MSYNNYLLLDDKLPLLDTVDKRKCLQLQARRWTFVLDRALLDCGQCTATKDRIRRQSANDQQISTTWCSAHRGAALSSQF